MKSLYSFISKLLPNLVDIHYIYSVSSTCKKTTITSVYRNAVWLIGFLDDVAQIEGCV